MFSERRVTDYSRDENSSQLEKIGRKIEKFVYFFIFFTFFTIHHYTTIFPVVATPFSFDPSKIVATKFYRMYLVGSIIFCTLYYEGKLDNRIPNRVRTECSSDNEKRAYNPIIGTKLLGISR